MANNSQRISPQDQWLFDGEDNLVGVKNPNVHGQDMLPLLYSVDPVTNVVTADITVTTLTTTGNATVGNASTDTLIVQAGSAALPSIIPTGDANTGIWFPAADTVAVSTAGVEGFRIDSTQSALNNAAGSGTNAYGFNTSSAKTGATNNYGFYSAIATAANRYNFYAAGTAPSVFIGDVGVGTTPASGYTITSGKNLTGTTTAGGMIVSTGVQSSVTSTAYGFRSSIGTAASSFTLNTLAHFFASETALGAGSTVTNQYGYRADSGLTIATNNYGFYGNIAAASGAWNFYAAGTANNAYTGNSSFGQVVAPIAAVDTTSFATNIVTNTAATYTVLTTDTTIIQTTAGSTYTLPAAASFTGRILNLVTQFAGAVISDASNVVPIAGGAAGTAILAATAGKCATLQSNGTNWIIISAN